MSINFKYVCQSLQKIYQIEKVIKIEVLNRFNVLTTIFFFVSRCKNILIIMLKELLLSYLINFIKTIKIKNLRFCF